MTRRAGVTWIARSLVYCPAFIGICTTEKAFHAACRKSGVKPYSWLEPDAAAMLHTWTCKAKTIHVVCVPPRGKITRAEYAALIVHEAAHVWQHIRDQLGEQRPSPEFEAYSIQSICQELFDAVGL